MSDGGLHQSGYRSLGRSQPSGRLQFELRLAQARRWKWNSVHLVHHHRSARQCLWALSMDSTRNNKYNKNMPPFGIWLRIRGYLADAASQINDYLARCASARRQWADHASYYGQASDTAITFDNVYAITSALADVRQLRESRLAIQNWIMAFANSKIVMIQSTVRGWLARLRCSSRVDNGLPVLGTGPVFVKEVLQEFALRLKDQPRRYTNPDRLIGDDR